MLTLGYGVGRLIPYWLVGNALSVIRLDVYLLPFTSIVSGQGMCILQSFSSRPAHDDYHAVDD